MGANIGAGSEVCGQVGLGGVRSVVGTWYVNIAEGAVLTISGFSSSLVNSRKQ